MSDFPKAALQLRDRLHDAGWSYALNYGIDTGGSPFLVIRGVPPGEDNTEVRASWHTRDGDTYWLYDCMVQRPQLSWQATSLKGALDFITPVDSLFRCGDCGERLDGPGENRGGRRTCGTCVRAQEAAEARS